MIQKFFIYFTIIFLIAACDVTYKAIGQFENFNEIYQGSVNSNLLVGGGNFTLTGVNSKTKCEGFANRPDIIPPSLSCNGQSGTGSANCSDGRSFDFRWYATSCAEGYGEGQTNDGLAFNFNFGLNEKKLRSRLSRIKPSLEKRPDLPAYRPKEVRKEKGYSSGTGFFVSDDGLLVTNYHVIEDATEISVNDTISGEIHVAKIVMVDPSNDIAILDTDVKSKPLVLSQEFQNRMGDEVFALGYPRISIQGQAQKATFGRINALSGYQDDVRFLQVDVPIQPGNSGGPLINNNGEVIGITTATLDALVLLKETGSIPQNVNYAVKLDYVLPTLKQAAGDRRLKFNTVSEKKEYSDMIAEYESSVVLIVAR